MKEMKKSELFKRKKEVEKNLSNMLKINIENIIVGIENAEDWILKKSTADRVSAHKKAKSADSFMFFIKTELGKTPATAWDVIFANAKYKEIFKEVYGSDAKLQVFWGKEPLEQIRWLLKVHDEFLGYHTSPDTF